MKSKFQQLKVYWRVLRLVFADTIICSKRETILLFMLVTFAALAPFLTSYVSAQLIDGVIGLADQEISQQLVFGMLAIMLAVMVIEKLLLALMSGLEKLQYYKLNEHFSFKFLNKASSLDLYHYENAKQNDLISRARESYDWRPQNVGNRLMWTLQSLVSLLTSVFIAATFSFPIFIVMIITTIPSLAVSLRASNEQWGIWQSDTELRRKYWAGSAFLSQDQSIMELRIFNTRRYLLNMLKGIYVEFNTKAQKAASKKAFTESVSTATAIIGLAIFWIYSIDKVVAGIITIGALTFYLSAMRQFSDSLQAFFRGLSYIYDDLKHLDDFYKFMELENKIIPGTQSLQKQALPPRIEFKNVDFTYPDSNKPVLTNFSLTIEPGQKVALVGENGAGKSTIIKLLARFYDVTGGRILIDGVDLRKLSFESWYSQLGVLFQDFVKYEFLSAGENIRVGDINSQDENSIQEAAHKADAHNFISKLERGYEQVLSKDFTEGTGLSGGQWQKIALARGFFRQSNILILDEPTSAIDAKAEFEIFNRLYEHSQGKTTIIISHRFSTVRQADYIYVIGEGGIIEQGTHEELIEHSGKYKEAFEKQAAGYN